MSKKTPDLIMEDYELIYPCKYPAWIMCSAFSEKERDIAKKGCDAGRKHFIENELREYLQMAVFLGIEKRLIDPGIEEIINKAKED